jgi:hypothetical protein
MSENTTSAKSNGTEASMPTVTVAPTGYRVSIVPGALEVSARLITPEEARNLVKVLRAGLAALEDTTDGDMDKPMRMTKPVIPVGIPLKK